MSNPEYTILAEQILRELEAYEPPPHHPESVGTALPPEWFSAGLERMRDALVAPYRLSVIDPETNPGVSLIRQVIIIANNRKQALLAFDPHLEGDFVLVRQNNSQATLSHVRGDAVGCFLAI